MRDILPKLGLPEEWGTLEGGRNYLRLIKADKRDVLDPFAKRIALVIFYFTYVQLQKTEKKSGKGSVAHQLLRPDFPEPDKPLLDQVAGTVRLGKWWWWLIATLGLGIFLTNTHNTAKSMHSSKLSNEEAAAFMTFILRTRPGTVRLSESLGVHLQARNREDESIGPNQNNLIGTADLFSPERLADAHREDSNGLVSHQTWEPWTNIDIETCANDKIPDFLALMRR
ncbi:hypothetical protein BO82DRAFT_407128 [Aspergillus uvarum CBS 121591]|uniref:Uncharacterized protein n=1 Tax=Aspergillus uvarum CBS 121591 TaxID=1448315 RepID=A0A319BUM8_9EURO|nr:hypothetical protein BO82DRAFT_407128 [Aspergillus uvarum CBS 121591]PYH76415.1 hypothetical protein BO82DRAFT_407128 [Aspergillus uvarum CBS 121591]